MSLYKKINKATGEEFRYIVCDNFYLIGKEINAFRKRELGDNWEYDLCASSSVKDDVCVTMTHEGDLVMTYTLKFGDIIIPYYFKNTDDGDSVAFDDPNVYTQEEIDSTYPSEKYETVKEE